MDQKISNHIDVVYLFYFQGVTRQKKRKLNPLFFLK